MKKYLIKRGLRRGSDFTKAIGIEPQATLEDLLHKAQAYIAYEEQEAAINIRNPRADSSRGGRGETKRMTNVPKTRTRDQLVSSPTTLR
jgi:DNA-binding SARP family transcriptional activator